MEDIILRIREVDNGYVCRYDDENDDGSYDEHRHVIQHDDHDDLKSGEELLWFIMEYFGFEGSKHDTERLRIVRESNVQMSAPKKTRSQEKFC